MRINVHAKRIKKHSGASISRTIMQLVLAIYVEHEPHWRDEQLPQPVQKLLAGQDHTRRLQVLRVVLLDDVPVHCALDVHNKCFLCAFVRILARSHPTLLTVLQGVRQCDSRLRNVVHEVVVVGQLQPFAQFPDLGLLETVKLLALWHTCK